MPDLDLSNRTLGEFVLRERIGVGGHGTLYRCEQRALGRDAVVKVLRPRKTTDAQAARFVREAKLASRLDHPYSATYTPSASRDDGVRWIAMELVQGVSLGDWLKARGPMPLAQFVPSSSSIAEVVPRCPPARHRAPRPQALQRHGDRERSAVAAQAARLRDRERIFDAPSGPTRSLPEDGHGGAADTTARLRAEPPPYRTRTGPDEEAVRLTPLGAVLGSAAYMSPEQWREPWSVGPAADIYALGCLAHEALTGRTPFTAEHTSGYRDLHLGAEPSALGDAFPPGVDEAIRRALAKSPDARQESVLELAAAFRAASLRAEPREQLRSAAQQWEDRARSPGLLWGREGLVEVERSVPPDTMSELECSFVAASHRRARRRAWVLRILVGAAACGAIGILAYRSTMRARLAEQRASIAQQQARAEHEIKEARITESRARAGPLCAAARRTRGAAPPGRGISARSRAHDGVHARPRDATSPQRTCPAPGHVRAACGGRPSRRTGTRIATADDRAAQVWDAKTYRLLFTLPHGCEVYQAVYSPDGTSLVTVAQTMVRIWDARTGALRNELRAKSREAPSDFYRAANLGGRPIRGCNRRRGWPWSGSGTPSTACSWPSFRAMPSGFPRLAFSVGRVVWRRPGARKCASSIRVAGSRYCHPRAHSQPGSRCAEPIS